MDLHQGVSLALDEERAGSELIRKNLVGPLLRIVVPVTDVPVLGRIADGIPSTEYPGRRATLVFRVLHPDFE
jgi:hypothetical protein